MATKHGFKYRGFILHCDPMPMADGRFGAQVAIANEEGKSHLERMFPSLDYFLTEDEAVAHSRAYGHRWIDDAIGTK